MSSLGIRGCAVTFNALSPKNLRHEVGNFLLGSYQWVKESNVKIVCIAEECLKDFFEVALHFCNGYINS